jgi:RING finger protein 113A
MADIAPPPPAFKKRTNKTTQRKRPATPPPQSSDSESDFTDDEGDARVKRHKIEGLTTATTISSIQKSTTDFAKSTKFGAERNTSIRENNDATKASTWYTDAALSDANPTDTTAGKERAEGTYTGAAGYDNFLTKNPEKSAASKHSVGPIKAPTNVRAIVTTDFAPDVCKDYKQTGFCGFGDSCKFLHAREDYKQGWQLDKEWEKAGKTSSTAKTSSNKLEDDDSLDTEAKMLKEIPFKCIICKEDYKLPVVAKCGHYFCEKCAMSRYMKEKKKGCAQCGADTRGTFGVAKKLKELLAKKQKREEERAELEAEE